MNKQLATISLALLPLPAFLFACTVGSYDLSVQEICSLILLKCFGAQSWLKADLPPEAFTIFFDVRLPRVLLAMLVGATLSVTGTTLQALFRNPLVDSYILGISSGSALGAALALAFIPIPVQVSAFVFGMLAVGLTYTVSYQQGSLSPVSLVLAGVMTNAIFTALLALVNIMIDPLVLQSIVLWTMGSLHLSSWSKLYAAWPWIAFALAVIYLKRWKLNILSFGDQEAQSLGYSPLLEKTLLILLCTVGTSTAVAMSGVIGIVGLMIPHIVRMLVGPDHLKLVPLSITTGAAYLAVMDTFSRSAATFEIPAGIFTTLLGAPFFIYLLRKTQAGGWL